jgi:hypothetical protein
VFAADDRARGQAGGGGQIAEIGEGSGAGRLSFSAAMGTV